VATGKHTNNNVHNSRLSVLLCLAVNVVNAPTILKKDSMCQDQDIKTSWGKTINIPDCKDQCFSS